MDRIQVGKNQKDDAKLDHWSGDKGRERRLSRVDRFLCEEIPKGSCVRNDFLFSLPKCAKNAIPKTFGGAFHSEWEGFKMKNGMEVKRSCQMIYIKKTMMMVLHIVPILVATSTAHPKHACTYVYFIFDTNHM